MANSTFIQYSWIILLCPLLSFVVNGLWLGSRNRKAASFLSLALSTVSLVVACAVAFAFWDYLKVNPGKAHIPLSYDWMGITDSFMITMGIYLDSISVMMLVVITVIATLVHVYSIGYMAEDKSSGRFFALLSFFCFSMLGLVIAPNIFQMFVFWELVGTASYSLIGFWYHKPSAVAASKKAFLVTRLADSFFLLGIVIVAVYVKDLSFNVLNSSQGIDLLRAELNLGIISSSALTIATICIFIGGWGKSAMFPLHVWLPDAMEGPTPVSSIIHSATMVVAGVFLTARLFPLFAAAETTLPVIEIVGAFTALFAAIIACTQKDIKRILAFSTLSQLGYMMFSLGTAQSGNVAVNTLGFSASMYHVFTHAFFKCMLFLGAGAVIHTVHNNSVDAMGGLKKKMPFTYWSLFAACLAIGGIYPLSGFWSKDEILLAALNSGSMVTFSVGLIVGGLTAFYMFRFFFLIFHGEARSDLSHAHEDPWMTTPIVILVIPTIIIGILSKDIFLNHVIPGGFTKASEFHHYSWLPWAASAMGIIGVVSAWFLYGRKKSNIQAALTEENRSGLYKIIQNKFYMDEIWIFVSKDILINSVSRFFTWIDDFLIDRTVDRFSALLHVGGALVRFIQSGKLIYYFIATLFGVLLLGWLGRLPF